MCGGDATFLSNYFDHLLYYLPPFQLVISARVSLQGNWLFLVVTLLGSVASDYCVVFTEISLAGCNCARVRYCKV